MSDSINEQRCPIHGEVGGHVVTYGNGREEWCPGPGPGPSVVTPPPTFDAMLRDPSEQFDRNSELLPGILSYLSGQERTEEVERLLRSVEAYRNAPSNTLGAPPRTVTPPAQDEQPEFVTYGPTPLPAAPSVSTDHTDEKKPWRAYGALDDAMLEARPNRPSAREAAVSDAAFAAGFRLGERLASGG